ncbi:MAG: sialidase family protein [Segetibacter sp.]
MGLFYFKKVSALNTALYNGYARVIQLKDKTLICVYEEDGSVVAVKSSDLGNIWAGRIIIAGKQSHINMAVPDVLELRDGSLLVCYNPRPFNIDPSLKICYPNKKSYDSGLSWKDERLLYEAGHTFDNGCWEPSAIQLPNGEIQLFFANEGIYQNSNEQNISILRSSDGGLTWTTNPQIVSFRDGKRDGMPSPLITKNKENILFSIEDNGTVNFKPYIIRSKVSDNWSTEIGGNSINRTYALADKIDDSCLCRRSIPAPIANRRIGTLLPGNGKQAQQDE